MDDNENDALQIEMNQRLSVLQNQLDYSVVYKSSNCVG